VKPPKLSFDSVEVFKIKYTDLISEIRKFCLIFITLISGILLFINSDLIYITLQDSEGLTETFISSFVQGLNIVNKELIFSLIFFIASLTPTYEIYSAFSIIRCSKDYSEITLSRSIFNIFFIIQIFLGGIGIIIFLYSIFTTIL